MLIAPVGCVGKKDTTPAATDTRLQSDVATLQTKVASLIDTVSNLDTPPNYEPDINELQQRVDDLEASEGSENVETLNIPQYALVTGVSHRYIAVTVYGAGDFPVLVYLYGEDLQAANVLGSEDWVVEAVEYREYDVVDVFLYGQAISTDTVPVTVPGQTVDTGLPEAGDPPPNDHTHGVPIPSQDINVPSATMGDTGTLMVVVVEPDDEWSNGYEFEIDIQGIDDNNGWVDFATASIGVRN